MKTSAHANIRSQQRGIPPLVIDLLMQFGTREHDLRGAEVLYFDRRSRKKLEAYAGGLIGKLNEHLDAYAIVSGGKVITVGARYKRINHS